MSDTLRELDQRTTDGIDVRLLWRPADDRVLVAVSDARTGDAFTIDVADRGRALDVFQHPYAYAPAPPRDDDDEIELAMRPDALHLFDPDTGDALR